VRMIFVNLPVQDLDASKAFFGKLGFEFNADFTDSSAACMVVDRNIFVMLLSHDRFQDFITGGISDARAGTEVITCLSVDRREAVDEIVATAIAAGGSAWKPSFAEGPMHGGSFQDLDGHVWELMYMQQ
jgi:predicted lactoylglutathione lyase